MKVLDAVATFKHWTTRTMSENTQDLGYYLSCQLCFVTLRDAVSLECNHSFCKTCVCTFWDQDENRKCPVCQMPASKEEPQINITLKELADVFAGRIPDPNVEKKKKKEEDYRFCTSHVVKPSWFCVNDNRLICEGCESVKKHVQHKLMRLKEVVTEMKASPEILHNCQEWPSVKCYFKFSQ